MHILAIYCNWTQIGYHGSVNIAVLLYSKFNSYSNISSQTAKVLLENTKHSNKIVWVKVLLTGNLQRSYIFKIGKMIVNLDTDSHENISM